MQYKRSSLKQGRENVMSKQEFMRKLKRDLEAGRISRRAAELLWEKAQ